MQHIQISEISNCLTDTLLAIILFYCSYQFKKDSSWEKVKFFQISYSFLSSWQRFFSYMAWATILGGLGHLLSIYVGKNILILSWLSTIWATFLIERDILNTFLENKKLDALLFLKSVTLSFGVLYSQLFLPVIIGLVIGLAGIVCTILYLHFLKTRDTAFAIIFVAILSSSLAALVRVWRIDLSNWFNANDLAHIISAFSFLGIYYGVRKVGEEVHILQSEIE